MSERLLPRREPKVTDAAKLRKWALIFLATGILGRAIFQNALLGANALSSEELNAAVDSIPGGMMYLSLALLCQFAETCAVPLFAFMLVEGYQRTGSFEKYLVRIAGIALVSELPYNLAMDGSLLSLSTRNPVFGLLIALVMLHFFSRFARKGLGNTAMKLLIFAAAFLWCQMLRIEHGSCTVIFTAILWLGRSKYNLRSLFGFCAAMLCTLLNRYYLGACLSCILLHRYNEEKGEQNRAFSYGFYPVCLLLAGIVSKFL